MVDLFITNDPSQPPYFQRHFCLICGGRGVGNVKLIRIKDKK